MKKNTVIKKRKMSSGLFVPFKSWFKELTDEVVDDSAIGIAAHFGYNSDQVYIWSKKSSDEPEIKFVVLEVFTRNIICVCTTNTVLKLDRRRVTNFLIFYHAPEVYDIFEIELILAKGIANKSLKADFLFRVLRIKEPMQNGLVFCKVMELNLYFKDDLLVSFESPYGFNVAASYIYETSPDVLKLYSDIAKKYWGDDEAAILNEVNTQAAAFVMTPDPLYHRYGELYRTEHGTYDFSNMLISHHFYEISLDKFLVLNHGRYEKRGEGVYRVGKLDYYFSEEGNFEYSKVIGPGLY